MFERPTVFIVGAGASHEVGFPLGTDLKKMVAGKVNIGFKDGWSQSSGDGQVAEAIRTSLKKLGERDANPHFSAGRSIAGAMTQAISIDNYLHAHADDARIIWIGKLGIARCILEAEANSALAHNKTYGEDFNLSRSEKAWYNTFFQMLTEGVQRSNLGALFSNVSIITFNYDRCIEHYLAHALANYYRMPHEEAAQLVQTLSIIHPYGQVGRLPWQQTGTVRFGKEIHSTELASVAEQLRTFTERVEDEAMLKRMRDHISIAEVVVYLGFSYGDMNMELLTVKESANKAIFGTSIGISDANRQIIERDIIETMGPSHQVIKRVELPNATCAQLLGNFWRPILRG
ncbi:hypothetical protein SFHH103_01638 [Sinorhizobium fredii HH103]|uniref:Uncharacterized protein n=1 Tax=Sinorhizobium fredii (strain HH103) TaxID=1117943 RepID=G9A7A5_SINF1|nr:SIR2 family protein [Sinorhizobium fredii]CCE96135.1 hypothetical protein SFHH103_01638 [Sinorhizobium fredii HH103]